MRGYGWGFGVRGARVGGWERGARVGGWGARDYDVGF